MIVPTEFLSNVIIRHVYSMPFLKGYALDLRITQKVIKTTAAQSLQRSFSKTAEFSATTVLQDIQSSLESVQYIEKCGKVYLDGVFTETTRERPLILTGASKSKRSQRTMKLSELTGRLNTQSRVLRNSQKTDEWEINFDYNDIANQSKVQIKHSISTSSNQLATLPEGEDVTDGILEVKLVQTNAPWNLERLNVKSVSGINGNYTYNALGGLGVSVYVIDSGINCDHVDFQGRAFFPVDFTNSGHEDDLGHGTHVAGIIGGTLFGVAKKSSLIGLKVFGGKGSTSWATILAAFGWAYEDIKAKGRPAIINLSLRGDYLEAANRAVAGFRRAGIPVVVSAGNDGVNACQFSPGSAPEALTVAAVNMLDEFLLVPPSNGGHCVDILAPGGSIVSDFIGSRYEIFLLSGTSMAAPHVTGTLAVLWSQYPFLSVDELIERMFAKAVKGQISGKIFPNTPNVMLRIS